MKKMARKIYRIIKVLGFDPVKTIIFLKNFPIFLRDLKELKKQKQTSEAFVFGPYFPLVHEKVSEAGTMSGHYFHQDLLVAKKIYSSNPLKHVDIGSRIDGFIAHVAVFREIEVWDIREQSSNIQNIKFSKADLMNLPEHMIDYTDSVSSLHAVEHFGLGRYGDPIDYNGHIKAIENIYLMLKIGGKFYFSVPVGRQRIEFNAHRVFNLEYLLKLFDNKFEIDSFHYVNDDGKLIENFELSENAIKNNLNCWFGCGIFEMTKV